MFLNLDFFSRIIITTPITLLEKETDPFTSWPSRAWNWISPAPIPSSRATFTAKPKPSSPCKSTFTVKENFSSYIPIHLSICQSANMRKMFTHLDLLAVSVVSNDDVKYRREPKELSKSINRPCDYNISWYQSHCGSIRTPTVNISRTIFKLRPYWYIRVKHQTRK